MLSSTIWRSLLSLDKKVKSFQGNISQIRWNIDSNTIRIIGSSIAHSQSIMIECDYDQRRILYYMDRGHIETNTANIGDIGMWIKLYLQTILARTFAKRVQRTITIGHFAQTLDGKIATVTNDSKWIGNEENLVHAHRMRALCDGIIVGRSTFQIDNPSLNVRHVEGNDPRKIIIGQGNPAFRALLKSRQDKIIAFVSSEFETNEHVQAILLPSDHEGQMECMDILSKLYELGIEVVYIEGGASTTSNFLRSKLLDYLQVHISPILFGSGKDAFLLPTIYKVDQAISFIDYDFYTIGRAPMFAGVLNELT